VLPQGRRINRINIIEKWPERLKSLENILLSAERGIKSHAEMMVKEKIHAERRISAAADCLQSGRAGVAGQAGNPESQIELLRVGSTSQQKQQAKRRNEQRWLFQVTLQDMKIEQTSAEPPEITIHPPRLCNLVQREVHMPMVSSLLLPLHTARLTFLYIDQPGSCRENCCYSER
jgi:hypothetical protein